MCPACEKEYKDPYDRRYHAQPVSCFDCGPTLSFYDAKNGEKLAGDPVKNTARKLNEGGIVAVKGLGGYHLACKATLPEAVSRLRELKGRETKPFALMGTMEMIEQVAEVSPEEKKYLASPASPILLLKRTQQIKSPPAARGAFLKNRPPGPPEKLLIRESKAGFPLETVPGIAGPVAPDLTELGFMLPYTPLHLLLLNKVEGPLVLTSANISDEPIIYKDDLQPIRQLCDYILTNDREIHIFADDSVARVLHGDLYMVRRSRGFVPLPLKLPISTSRTVLALGPMLKTTFTFLFKAKAIMSQYIGDTDSPASIEAEKTAIGHLKKLFSLQPDLLVVDKHPGYPNREITADFENVPVVEIQHHKAHVGALLAERGETGKILGIAMDGTGYGDDGKIWGGEFFVGDYRGLRRFGHLKYLFLPSGDRAAKEPWRFALAVLYSLYGAGGRTARFARQFGKKGEMLLEAIEREAGGILTSSCGRIFDAAAALLGIGNYNSYEGEMPIKLQALAEAGRVDLRRLYDFAIEREGEKHILNLLPTFRDLIETGFDDVPSLVKEKINQKFCGGDYTPRPFGAPLSRGDYSDKNLKKLSKIPLPGKDGRKTSGLEVTSASVFSVPSVANNLTAERAFIFHNTLAHGIAAMAEIGRKEYGISKVGLTGGVFQNVLLLELTKNLLLERGFEVLIHRLVPPNDGGVSLGQAFLALHA